ARSFSIAATRSCSLLVMIGSWLAHNEKARCERTLKPHLRHTWQNSLPPTYREWRPPMAASLDVAFRLLAGMTPLQPSRYGQTQQRLGSRTFPHIRLFLGTGLLPQSLQ